MGDYVPDAQRDEVIKSLLQMPDNKVCFDCASKNPKWCSASIGIFLCYQCSGTHRAMGVHISFVRSLKLDRWKARELKQMELGGNKAAKTFYEKNGMLVQGQPPDHKNPALTRYKNDLKSKSEKALGVEPSATNQGGNIVIVQKQENKVIDTKPDEEKKIEEVAAVSKKPRAFVGGEDIFDFSGMQKSAGGLNIQKSTQISNAPALGSKVVNLSAPKQVEDANYNLGNLFQGNQQKQSLNAKKLDINFDADDFFNQFDPETIRREQQAKQKEAEKLKKQSSEPSVVEKKITEIKAQSEKKPENLGKLSDSKDDDVQARYEQLVKSGVTAISSDMLFGREEEAHRDTNKEAGRWSTPATISAIGEKLQDIRSSVGSGGSIQEYKASAKETADKLMEKSTYVANGAYNKASQAKHAALDWITSMTQSTGIANKDEA